MTESRHVGGTVLGKLDLWPVVASTLRLEADKTDVPLYDQGIDQNVDTFSSS